MLRESPTGRRRTAPTRPAPALRRACALVCAGLSCAAPGCLSPEGAVENADAAAYSILEQKQLAAIGRTEPFSIDLPEDTLRRRLLLDQNLPAASPASFGSLYLPPVPKQPDGVTSGPDALPAGAREQIIGTRNAPTPGVNNPSLSTDLFLVQLGPRGTVRRVVAEPAGFGAVLGPPTLEDFEAVEPLTISLLDALQIGARNSRDYQTRKETLYQVALDLDLERDRFEFRFTGAIDADFQSELEGDDTSGVSLSPSLGVNKLFKSGAILTSRIGLDLAKLLTGNEAESLGLLADASITIPLLQGAGVEVVAEPLQQAERDVIYAIWDFERFKQTFAIDVVGRYFNVLQAYDQITNAQGTYNRLKLNSQRSYALFQAGELPAVQVDQVLSNELNAYSRVIRAQQSYDQQLDNFKVFLGLPPDATVLLDPGELDRLKPLARRVLGDVAEGGLLREYTDSLGPPATQPATQPATGPSTEPVLDEQTLDEAIDPTRQPGPTGTTTRPVDPREVQRQIEGDNVSPLGVPVIPLDLTFRREAIRVALSNRLDLAATYGEVIDAQRRVVVAADGLEGVFDLVGSVNLGGGRGPLSGGAPDTNIRFDEGSYAAGLRLDLPIERTAERNAYRNSLIALERAVRGAQEAEDGVKLNVINALRDIRVAAEDLRVQSLSLEVAQRRLDAANAFFREGQGQARDITEAEADLVDAQNSLTGALVDLRVAELSLQRDLGLLRVSVDGLYEESEFLDSLMPQ